jgi:8-oxo-dGTP diphosphatase
MDATQAMDFTCNSLKRRATVICRHEEEILFVRKRNAKWNLPGGRVEKGETPLQAAMREMAEETGLIFDQLSYVSQYRDDKVVHFLFEAIPGANQKPRAANEIDDCRWFTVKELGKRNVRSAIRTLLKRCAADMGREATVGKADWLK